MKDCVTQTVGPHNTKLVYY